LNFSFFSKFQLYTEKNSLCRLFLRRHVKKYRLWFTLISSLAVMAKLLCEIPDAHVFLKWMHDALRLLHLSSDTHMLCYCIGVTWIFTPHYGLDIFVWCKKIKYLGDACVFFIVKINIWHYIYIYIYKY
jgi:hypothetical protein